MNLRLFVSGALACFCCVAAVPSFAQVFGTDPATGRSALVDRVQSSGEAVVIVKLGDPGESLLGSADKNRIAALQESVISQLGTGVRVHRKYKYLPYLAVFVDVPALDALASLPEVQLISPDASGRPTTVEPDVLEALAAVPTDESRNVINAQTAINNGCDGSGWTVAVLDTGMDIDHEAFVPGRIVSEACYSTHSPPTRTSLCPGNATSSTAPGSGDDCLNLDASDPNFMFYCPHGSLIGGVIAGDGSGSTSVNGTFPDLTMISIKVFTKWAPPTCSAAKSCALASASDIMAGLERVADLADTFDIGATVLTVDMSFDPLYSVFFSEAACDAAFPGIKDGVALLNSYGIPVVGGTGNRNASGGISPPVCLSNIISVGNSGDGSGGTTVDTPQTDSNWASFMDFFAPGKWITTAFPSNSTFDANGNSVSAPHVAATYAALRSNAPTSAIDYFTSVLTSTGVNLTQESSVTKPRIDAGAACQAMEFVAYDGHVFLEGAFDTGTGQLNPGAAYTNDLPLTQPFGHPDFSGTTLAYTGDEAISSLPPNTVDWVAVSLRTGTAANTEIARRPALVETDGDIVDIRGGDLGFLGVAPGSYYVVVDHSNHLSVMSKDPVDFSSGTGLWHFSRTSRAFGTNPQKDLGVAPARFGMFAGDSNLDGVVQALDFNEYIVATLAGASGYQREDFNLDGAVQALDFNLYIENTSLGATSAVP